MSIIARIDQQVTFSPIFKDAFGNLVTDFGTSLALWSVSDAALATIVASNDGMQATVTPTGHVGDVEVNMVINASLDATVDEIVGKATISFKPGKAVFVSLGGLVADTPAPVVSAPVEQSPVAVASVAPVEVAPAVVVPAEPVAPVEVASVELAAVVEVATPVAVAPVADATVTAAPVAAPAV